jgi:hypothetical protein
MVILRSRSVPGCGRASKDAKARIQLPSFIFPRGLIRDIIQIGQSHHISRPGHYRAEVQLRTTNQREIAFLEGISGIVDQMLILVEQDALLRSRQKTEDRDRSVAEQHRDREPVELPLHVVDAVRHHCREICSRAIVRLIEIQFRLETPLPGNIDLSEYACHVPELEFLAERLPVDFEKIGAGFNAQMKALCLRMQACDHQQK